MKKTIYKITINNWNEYNSKSKPNMPSIFVSKRFFDDVKIQSLPQGGKLLWLGLLLRRGDVEETFFEASHEDLVRFAGGSGQVVQRLMVQLESLQLLTYEKTSPNRIELKGIELKGIEKKGAEIKKQPQPPASTAPVQEIIAHYCDCWKARYGASAPISGKTSGQLKQFVKDHGFEKSKILISAYLDMADGWFLTKRHDIPTLLGNINSVALFAETGKMITKREVANHDSAMTTKNLIDQIKKDGI